MKESKGTEKNRKNRKNIKNIKKIRIETNQKLPKYLEKVEKE